VNDKGFEHGKRKRREGTAKKGGERVGGGKGGGGGEITMTKATREKTSPRKKDVPPRRLANLQRKEITISLEGKTNP